jgi:hypothetical protein
MNPFVLDRWPYLFASLFIVTVDYFIFGIFNVAI